MDHPPLSDGEKEREEQHILFCTLKHLLLFHPPTWSHWQFDVGNLCLKWILLCLTFIKSSLTKGPVYGRIDVHLTPNSSSVWWLLLPMILPYILGHFPYAWLGTALSLLLSNTNICCPYSMDIEAPCPSSFQAQHWTHSKRCCLNPTMQATCSRQGWPFVTFGEGGGPPRWEANLCQTLHPRLPPGIWVFTHKGQEAALGLSACKGRACLRGRCTW